MGLPKLYGAMKAIDMKETNLLLAYQGYDMDTFKTRLRFYMEKAGFNPSSLSRKAELNATAVRDILNHTGSPNPRIDTFIKLCQALEIGRAHV